jgi:hypothetical protein
MYICVKFIILQRPTPSPSPAKSDQFQELELVGLGIGASLPGTEAMRGLYSQCQYFTYHRKALITDITFLLKFDRRIRKKLRLLLREPL